MIAQGETTKALFGTTAFRLAALTIAGFLFAAAVIVVALIWQVNGLLTQQVIASIDAERFELQRQAAQADATAITAIVAARSRPRGPALYFLADKQGKKLSGNLNHLPPEIAQRPEGGTFRYQQTPTSPERLAVAVPVKLKHGLNLIVGRDIDDQRAISDSIRQWILLGFGALSLVALGAGLAVSRMMLRRVETINQTSKSIMAGDLSQRIPLTGSGDEFDDLSAHLNAMIERVELLMNSLREVSDNIAHDLKTPLNRLRNHAEAALRDPQGGPAYREGLERTIDEADDLIKTFNALLLIARLEARAFEGSREVFDVSELLNDAVELYEPVAEEAGLELRSSISGSGFNIFANRQLISQALTNLIDNALKYGRRQDDSEKAALSVELRRDATSVEIAVADHGPGIAAADKERVLKRFVRLEECRTPPGTGLGLSLVAAVARLHDGRVRLEDNAPGLRAVLALPVHKPAGTV